MMFWPWREGSGLYSRMYNPRQKLILVTGATGALGPTIVKLLYASGFRIRTFALDSFPECGIPLSDIEVFRGNIVNKGDVELAVKGVDAIIHMAALLHIPAPSTQMAALFRKVNVEGTRNITEAAGRYGIRRIVFFSTISVYGPSQGIILDERSRTRPETIYGQTKREAEEIVLNARNIDDESIGTVLRLAAVYGSGIKGNYQRLLKALKRGYFIPIGRGENRRTLIYEKDLARAAIIALEHPASVSNIFNVTDGGYHSLNEIIRAMCNALGRRPPMISLPAAPVCFFMDCLEQLSVLSGFNSFTGAVALRKYMEDTAVDGTLIQTKLGFRPRFDLATGWQNTLKEMKVAGSL